MMSWLKITDRFEPSVLPANFRWQCPCRANEGGFPGCRKVKCFRMRVFLALTEFHQHQESLAQDAIIERGRHLVLIRPDCFPEERKALHRGDLATAYAILMGSGS